MYGLPPSTHLTRQLPKKAIYEKFALTAAQRQRLDADIARLDIVAQLAPHRLPSLAEGTSVKGIYVVEVSLKTQDYSRETITLLSRLIPQHMLFVLRYQQQAQLAIVYQGFHAGSWLPADQVTIPVGGLDLDSLWAQLVTFVGGIVRDQSRSLEDQLLVAREQDRLRREIAQLEARMNKERALNKQMHIRSQINQLRKRLDKQTTTEH